MSIRGASTTMIRYGTDSESAEMNAKIIENIGIDVICLLLCLNIAQRVRRLCMTLPVNILGGVQTRVVDEFDMTSFGCEFWDPVQTELRKLVSLRFSLSHDCNVINK